MSEKRKMIRPNPDGTFDAIRFDEGGSGYDRNLPAATADAMMKTGGYAGRPSDDVDFEAARMLAGLDVGGDPAEEVTLALKDDGDDDASNDQFSVSRRLRSGAVIGQDVPRSMAGTLQGMGGARVRINQPGDKKSAAPAPLPTPLSQDPSDAKLSGASNPQRVQDWSDTGPRPSMPRAGIPGAAPRKPSIQVQRPDTGDGDGFINRLKAGLGSRPAAPSASIQAALSPQAQAYALQGNQDPLAAAREQSSGRRFGTQIARAGAMVNEALTGAKMDRPAWDALEAQSEEPLQDLAMGRKMRFEDAAEGRAQSGERRANSADARAGNADMRASAGEQREADLSDPASRASRQARSQLLLRYPKQAAQLAPEDLRSMSAMDVQSFLKGFGEDRDDVARAKAHSESIAARQAATGSAKANRELRKAELKAAAEQKRTDAQTRDDELDGQKLAQRAQGNANTVDDLRTITGFLDAGGGQGDLPGVGPVVSAFPEMMVSSEGVALRQAANRLYRAVVREESGQTVTPQEAATALESFGMGAGKSEDAFRQGIASLAQRAQRALKNTESGFPSRVVEQRRQQGGVTSQDIPRPGPRPTNERIRMPDGRVFEVLSDGTTRQVK